MQVKLSEIKVEYNPRQSFEGIDELAKSIKESGLIQPLTVAKQNGHFTLLDGGRRYRALSKLKVIDVSVNVVELDEQQQKEVPIITDFFKDKLNIVEKAFGLFELVDKKYTIDVICKKFNLKKVDVKRMMKIPKLNPTVIKLVESGQIKLREVDDISKIKDEVMQIKVATFYSERSWEATLVDALDSCAFEIDEDSVFSAERVKADGKLGIEVYDEEEEVKRIYTYDEEYYNKVRQEQEVKFNELRSKQEQRSMKTEESNKPLTAEAEGKVKAENKKKRTKAKGQLDTRYQLFVEATTKFLSAKASDEQRKKVFDSYVEKLGMGNCKLICKAFKIEYTGEWQSEQFTKAVSKLLEPLCKTDTQLIKLIHFSWATTGLSDVVLFRQDNLIKAIKQLS